MTVIGILGGTGSLGSALAARWARADHRVLIGSRNAGSAGSRQEFGLEFATNAEVAKKAEICVLTVPFAAQEATLLSVRDHLAGKILVDATVPLVPPKVMRAHLVAEGSAALRTQSLVGDGVRVVSAFHNVAAHKLAADAPVECDVLVFSDDGEARTTVARLADDAGLRGVEAGSLANSVAGEALTSVLIWINRYLQVDGAGIRITGSLVSRS